MKQIFLFFFIILLVPCMVNGQDFSYVQYNVKDGLAGATVYCLAEDRQGFLWIGTETGLSRFDGTRFRNFTTEDGLPDNEILRLSVDSKNRVWIMPFRSSICFYHEGKIYSQETDSLLKQIEFTSEAIAVQEDKQGNIVIVQRNSIWMITVDGRVLKARSYDNSPISALRAGIGPQGQVQVFFASTRHRAFLVDVTSDNLLSAPKNYMLYYPGSFTSTYISPNLSVFRQLERLVFLNNGKGKIGEIPVPENFIGVSALDDSVISVNTGGNAARLINVYSGKETGTFLPGHYISSAYKDKEGNLWFTTLGQGVFRLTSFEFRQVKLQFGGTSSPAYCVYKSNDKLLIGGDNFVLYTYDMSSRQVTHNKLELTHSQRRITSILDAGTAGIILGTDAGVARIQDKNKKRILPFLSIKGLSLFNDTLYISTGFNVIRAGIRDLSVIDTIWHSRSTSALSDGRSVYIGTLNGLFSVDHNKRQKFLGEKISVLRNRISDITESRDGTLWVSTYGGGIAAIRGDSLLVNLTERNGLSSNICRSLYYDGSSIWVGTDKGISKISYSDTSHSLINYSSSDGINSDVVNAIHVEDSLVFVATPTGMTYFNENNLSQNSICVLQVTSTTVSGEEIPFPSSPLLLGPEQNNIRIEYVGISYKSAGDITYFYRLNGIDREWKRTRDAFLEYLSLPPGSYVLQLYAVNKFGVRSEEVSIPFTIDKPLHEKSWFRVLIILGVFLLIWLFIHLRIRSIRKEESEKQVTARKLAELEQMALKSQMNPHFIFNSLNSIQQYVIEKDIIGANKFITEFARLIRMTLEYSDKAKVSLSEERDFLSTYLQLEHARFEGKFSFQIDISPTIDKDNTYIPPLILQPYIENSIRHGVRFRKDNNGKIAIRFQVREDRLICTIEDNGIGRKMSAAYKSQSPIEYHSKGMTLTAKRIEMLNKTQTNPIFIDIDDLHSEDGSPAGTRVTLGFPLQESFKQV